RWTRRKALSFEGRPRRSENRRGDRDAALARPEGIAHLGWTRADFRDCTGSMPGVSLGLFGGAGRRPQCLDEAARVIRLPVPLSVDEDAWGSLNTAVDPTFDIHLDARQAGPLREIGMKPVPIQTDRRCVHHQILIRQRTLTAKQQLVHLPELSLEVCGLRGQSRLESVRVN